MLLLPKNKNSSKWYDFNNCSLFVLARTSHQIRFLSSFFASHVKPIEFHLFMLLRLELHFVLYNMSNKGKGI